MRGNSGPGLRYRPEIDGLRALAVVPVMLFHAGVGGLPGGFVGVDVFFVISGYLITRLLVRDLEQGSWSLLGFYERRARRILPALVVVVAACLPFAWALMFWDELRTFGESLVAVGVFASNALFWWKLDYFSPNADEQPLVHTWSLAVEEQYYLLFPLMLLVLWRLGRARLAIVCAGTLLASLAWAEWASRFHPSASFYLLPSRAWELLVGVLTALGEGAGWFRARHVPSGVAGLLAGAGLVLLTGAMVSFDSSTGVPGLPAILPVVGTALVLAYSGQNAVGRLLATRPLVAIGLASYSLYLWHQPVLAFSRLAGWDDGTDLRRLLIVSAALPLGIASFRWVERPFRRHGAFSRGAVYASGGGALALSVALGLVLHFGEGFPDRVPLAGQPAVKGYLAVKAERHAWEHWCEAHAVPSGLGVPVCQIGAAGVAPDIVLWGDSYAGALMLGLDAELRRAHRAALVFHVTGCPPLPGLRRPGPHGCLDDVHGRFVHGLVSLGAIKHVVWYGRVWSPITLRETTLNGEPTTNAALKRVALATLERLRASGKRVVLVQPGPRFPVRVPEFYARHALRGEASELTVPRAAYAQYVAAIRELRPAVDTGGAFVDTEDFFCRGEVCSARHDYGLAFIDHDHLSFAAARALSKLLVPHLN